MKKKILIILGVVVLFIIALVPIYFIKVKPLNEAKEEYNNVIASINNKNKQLDNDAKYNNDTLFEL